MTTESFERRVNGGASLVDVRDAAFNVRLFDAHQQKEIQWVAELSVATEDLLLAWLDFKSGLLNDRMTSKSDRDFALVALAVRQVGLLESAAACTKAKRAEGTEIINRTMFEGWASMVALSSYRDREWNPERLGSRFLQHSDFILRTHTDAFRSDVMAMAKSRGVPRDKVADAVQPSSASRFPFRRVTDHWFPPIGKGSRPTVSNMLDALWPAGKNKRRKFPRELFPFSRKVWIEHRMLFWEIPSLSVHVTGRAASSNRPPARDALFDDASAWNCHFLTSSIELFYRSIGVMAHVVNAQAEWDGTSHAALQRWTRVCSESKPFLMYADD